MTDLPRMSDLGDLLELLHSSPSLWRTLRASGTEWTEPQLYDEAYHRGLDVKRPPFTHSGAKTRSTSVSARSTVSFAKDSSDNEPTADDSGGSAETWRLWIEQPDRRRVGFDVGLEQVTAVWVGDTWWSWSPSGGSATNNGEPNVHHGKGPSEPLIETTALLAELAFEVEGRANLLGREVLKARATHRPLPTPRMALFGLGSGADDYLLSVDAERGVVLRSEARLRGKPFKVIEMTEIDFDLPLPPETFSPPGPEQ